MSNSVPRWTFTDVSCPTCRAPKGEPCDYRGHTLASKTHLSRQDKAHAAARRECLRLTRLDHTDPRQDIWSDEHNAACPDCVR